MNITIIGKVNLDLEFVSIKSIKGSFIKSIKSESDDDTGIVIEWSTWHSLGYKTRLKYNFIVFSKKGDWCEDVWQSSTGSDLLTNMFYNFNKLIVAGGGKHIKRVMDAVDTTCIPTRIIAVPTKSTRSGAYHIPAECFRDVAESDNVHVFVS